MLKTLLFDLDGTLLPMDQDVFVKSYLKLLAQKMAPLGYEPKKLVDAIWAGTGAMVKNDGSMTNEERFWKTFTTIFGEESMADLPIFEDFYRNEFQNASKFCGFDARAAELIKRIKQKGYEVILATNPVFPAIATESRIRWAGLNYSDFKLITSYENSSRSKPNPDYYREIVQKAGLLPEECMMVGNDVQEDMVAAEVGMKVFLLTDCMIDRNNTDLSSIPHGSFPELLEYIDTL